MVVVLGAGCGPAVRTLSWPPAANPTIDGLYPYDFERRGLAGVRALYQHLMSARYEEADKEQMMLYALGRAQIDAFLYAMTLEEDVRAMFLDDLGDMLGQSGATEETFMADPGLLLEPFDILAIKYPKSIFASAPEDGRIAFRLLTHEGLGDEDMDHLARVAADQGPLSAFVRAVMLVTAADALEQAASRDAGKRSASFVEALDRYTVGASAEDEELEDGLVRVLGWASSVVATARKDPDPLFIDLRPVTVRARDLLASTPFPSGLPTGVSLPERVAVPYEVEDPFRYVVVDGTGKLSVATSRVHVVDEDGAVVLAGGGKDPFAWPGKSVEDPSTIPAVLAEATASVAFLGPAGGSPIWDRAVPLAVDPAIDVGSMSEILDVVRVSMDHVVVAVRVGRKARYISSDVRPNCAMAGTRLGAVLGSGKVSVDNVTVGSEDQVVLTNVKDEQPLLLAMRVADQVKGIVDRPRPDVFVEVAVEGGVWNWGQLVAVEEGLNSAVAQRAEAEQVEISVQSFLLPAMTMAETRQIEIEADEGTLGDLPDPTQVTREELVLRGAYGDYDQEVQDAWLSAYLDPLPLDLAATVVLDVARCWGGDYRERAVEALSMGKRSVLEHVGSYLGDPVMDWVAQSILADAGERAVPVLVRKLRSKDEPVWTGAWTVIASMGSGDIGSGLVPLLEDPDPELRIRALKLYGNSMPAGDHPELLPLLDDPDLMVRRWALATVGMLGVEDAVPRLLKYAKDKKTPPGVLAEALFSLGLLEVHEAVPAMVAGAGHESTEVREAVALTLGNVGADGVLEPLLGLLGDDEPTVALNAIQSVGILADEAAIPYLEGLVDSPHPALAEASWLAIERIRAANTVSLAEMDDEGVEQVCDELGAEHLAELAKNPGMGAMSCLISKLTAKDPEVREAACVALGERGDPKAMSKLKKRTKDKIKAVRKAAWKALKILDKIKKMKSK
jgi:HEAT repeat protein